MTEELNLQLLNKSRKKIKCGDIFVFKPKGHNYYYGRVINTNANSGFNTNAILIYLYNSHSENKKEIPELNKENLLVPPIFINRLPWSKGYFETIKNMELKSEDILSVNCFWDSINKRYMDDQGNILDGPHEPIGQYGLASYRLIDDEISEVLDIPFVPD